MTHAALIPPSVGCIVLSLSAPRLDLQSPGGAPRRTSGLALIYFSVNRKDSQPPTSRVTETCFSFLGVGEVERLGEVETVVGLRRRNASPNSQMDGRTGWGEWEWRGVGGKQGRVSGKEGPSELKDGFPEDYQEVKMFSLSLEET